MKTRAQARANSPIAAALLVALSGLAVARVGWLTFRTAPITSPLPTIASQLTPEEYAVLAAACPSAMEILQAPAVERTAFVTSSEPAAMPIPAARITGVRIAQAPAKETSGDWLVSPEEWYAPEDKPKVEAPKPVEPPKVEAEPEAKPQAAEEKPAPPVVEEKPPAVEVEKPVVEEPTEDDGLENPSHKEEEEPASPSEAVAPTIELPAPPVEEPAVEAKPEVEEVAPPVKVKPFAPPPAPPKALSLGSPPPAAAEPAKTSPFAPPASPLSPHGAASAKPSTPQSAAEALKAHQELFAKNNYPSALECAKCHQEIYDQWSISSHAYAYVSPMFHKFEQRISELSNGTVGYFCTRCHGPTVTAMCLPREMPLGEMPAVAREGITCVACHRINQRYAKTNGERHVIPGDVYAPVYGEIGGDGVAEVIAKKSDYKVKTSAEEKGAGLDMHTEGRFFEHLDQSEYCTACHQVAVHPGIKLEVVWEQYRASPACKKGVTCQACHMGKIPGVASGYEVGAIAKLNDKTVRTDRLKHNHIFYGPGYSIAHPGIFPLHEKASKWTFDEWLSFDWRAGWGTDKFEDAVEDGQIVVNFPQVWKESDDRYDAREIIEDNLAKLAVKKRTRHLVMEAGSHVAGPHFECAPSAGQELKFSYTVTNTNEGHNLPTASLGAQPQLWANVVLIGPTGERLWESGYLDSYGDLCDIHSRDVRNKLAPFDWQLFNLQTMFLITGATGTDRELPLPVNIDIDQVAQLRPGAIPITVTNHPPFIRMESRSLAPLGSKRVNYKIPAELVCRPGRYRLSFRMRSRTEPIYFMNFCRSTPEMDRAMLEGILDIHTSSNEFEVR